MIYFEAFYILSYLFVIKLQYILGRSRYRCINDIATFLSKKNLIYTKCFQSLTTNNSILSKQETDIFKKYTDNVPYSEDELYNINDIINTLNKGSTNKLTLLSDKPYGSGIIAVVYEGKLNDKNIIIKVIRKNINNKLNQSLKICNCIINFLNLFHIFKLYDIKTIFAENKNDIQNQLNFNKEIENNKIMYNNYKNIEEITIPYVYDEYSKINNKVIIMDKLYGNSVYQVNDVDDKNAYFDIFNKFILKSILFNRTYHADLHPGNMFFNKKNNKYQIGIIDFGLVGKLTKPVQNDLFNFLKYIVIDKDIEKSTMLVINKLIDFKDAYNLLSIKDKLTINSKINYILEDIITKNKRIDMDFIYNANKLLNKYNLKLSRKFCKVILGIAIASNVNDYLTVNNDESNLFYNNIKLIINEIVNPKILDLDD